MIDIAQIEIEKAKAIWRGQTILMEITEKGIEIALRSDSTQYSPRMWFKSANRYFYHQCSENIVP